MKEAMHGLINDYLVEKSTNRNLYNLHIPPSKMVNNMDFNFIEVPRVTENPNEDPFITINADIIMRNVPYVEESLENTRLKKRKLKYKKLRN